MSLRHSFNQFKHSHWLHDQHINSLDEITSTWKMTPNGPQPRSFFEYCFMWPGRKIYKGLVRIIYTGLFDISFVETLGVVTLNLALVIIDPIIWVLYVTTLYFGWACSGAINYMQHPPADYGFGYTTSIYSRIYNRIFFNNGLHWEHHKTVHHPIS